MSVYARQFVEQLSRPDVDLITGIPPTVSIEQRTSRGGGKSTVATVTEIHHFIRLLFARLGTQFCPDCQVPVEAQTRDELGRHLQGELRRRGDLLLLAPVVKNRKGFHTDVAEWAASHGFAEVRADGKLHPTSEILRLDRFREHNVEIVVGVLPAKRGRGKLTKPSLQGRGPRAGGEGATKTPQELIDEALKLGNGTLLALDNHRHLTVHSTERACPNCDRSFEPLDPRNFSYNSPQGWCPRCRGFGELFYLPDVDRGARADAIEESWYGWQEGSRELCPECQGARLNPGARAVRLVVGDERSIGALRQAPTIGSFSQMSVAAGARQFRGLRFKGRAALIARDILPEIRERLKFLEEVGLGYLQLGRGVPTLSGGESQRIRLAAQLGSNLSGVLYILDEPTIGLHARDNEQLLAALRQLKARGNSVLVVEHDDETMRQADFIVDLGPGAGVHGGQVVAAGTLVELMRHPESITGQCLRVRKKYPTRGKRREVSLKSKVQSLKRGDQSLLTSAATGTNWLMLTNADKNNLRDLTVKFPLGRFVAVTGVSGSGKSTLIRECLLPAVTEAVKSRKKTARGATRTGQNARPTGQEPYVTGF